MLKVSTKGLRVVGILAMAIAVAQCGDSDVRVSTGPGVVPSPGTFTGTLSDGGTIRIEVGSIEEVEFTCDDEVIRETFTPPRPIDSDGTFDIGFSEGGREFQVSGTFRDNNNVDGTINDEDNECDVSFDAGRGTGGFTPTPARTPTPGGGATETPDGGPTSTGGGPTSTAGGPTFTPGGGVLTPTPVQTGQPNTCPVAVEVLGNAGSQKVLDTGSTGLAHNATVISDGALTFTLDCPTETRPCGVCNVSGPIQNVEADDGTINARRCSTPTGADTFVKCDDTTTCPNNGTCQFFFGAPLPLAAGGIGTCVTNQVNGSISGTANIESGAFASAISLTSRVFTQVALEHPCPRCIGDSVLNDGNAGGTCDAGVRSGQACDGNGTSPTADFGTTSLDCPPQGLLTALQVPLEGSSGTETRTLSMSSPNCTGTIGKKCFCEFGGFGQPTVPNACLDDTTTPGTVEECVPVSGSPNEGVCVLAPPDRFCTPTETYRGCGSNADCQVSGDTCQVSPRPCFLDNGTVGNSVTAVGEADPPSNGVSNPTFASLFCVGAVAQPAVNAAAGLPGLGRIELPLRSEEILTLP